MSNSIQAQPRRSPKTNNQTYLDLKNPQITSRPDCRIEKSPKRQQVPTPTTNQLKMKNQINLLRHYVTLSVLATYYLCMQFSSHVILSLALQPNNDVLPQQYQHNNILRFEVSEGLPNNTFVGNIRSADGQKPYLVVPMAPTPESERRAAFNINFNTGDLTTNSVLDREHRDQYHFLAIVQEPFAEIKCTVIVKDVNDNAPMFLMPTPNETKYVIEMPENQQGIRKVLPLAIDYDTPQFGIKEFRIVSGNTPSGLFQLVEHEAPARSTFSQGQAEQDSASSAAAMLGAADNPALLQQLAQQATVLVPSQPVVQTPPLASSTTAGTTSGLMHSSSSSSSASQSSSAQQATASAAVYPMAMSAYSQQQAIAGIQSKFLIDLEVSQPLDREAQPSYQLVVEAIDGGQSPGRLMVTVNVQDINDNTPIFTRKSYECKLKEDLPRGTLLIGLKANDLDSGSNGLVSYYIESHTSSSQTATTLNQVTNSTSDNNEVSARYISRLRPQAAVATVGASNSGGNGKQSHQQNRQANSIESMDNSASNDAATQPFKLKQAYPAEQLFDIDPNKGDIYLVNALDYETDHYHEITVVARDHGEPMRSNSTIVRVYVLDVDDSPVPSAMNRIIEDRKYMPTANLLAGDPSRPESSASSHLGGADFVDVISQPNFNIQSINWSNLVGQLSSSTVFIVILIALLVVAFSVFLVKIKSRQPESVYNERTSLTTASNNGQTKPSPNHSSSNLEHPGTLDSIHHRHSDHQHHPNGSSFVGLNGTVPFGSSNGKMSRHQYMSDNLYHNLHAVQRPRHHSSTSHHMAPDSLVEHQMAPGQGGSRGGTLTLHSHRHHRLLADHPLDHHHHQFAPPNHNTTSSLTYAHHLPPLLHQANNHHQSTHHLASIHQANKSGTMNSIGTHNSAHHAPSASPASPNTGSSQMRPNHHDAAHHQHSHHNHHHQHVTNHNQMLPSLPQNQNGGLPSPPYRGADSPTTDFPFGPTHDDCFALSPDGLVSMETPGSTMNSHSTNGGGSGAGLGTACSPRHKDRWSEIGVSPDWCGSYNWDYLNDWQPAYHTLMPLVLDTPGY